MKAVEIYSVSSDADGVIDENYELFLGILYSTKMIRTINNPALLTV